MRSKLTLRNVFLLVFALCVAWATGFLILRHFTNAARSPLDVLQCYGLVLCGALALMAAIHNSRGATRRLYALLMLVAIGLSLSAIIMQPAASGTNEQIQASSAAVRNFAAKLPLANHLETLLGAPSDRPPAESSSQNTLPLLGYSILALITLWQVFRKTPERRRFG